MPPATACRLQGSVYGQAAVPSWLPAAASGRWRGRCPGWRTAAVAQGTAPGAQTALGRTGPRTPVNTPPQDSFVLAVYLEGRDDLAAPRVYKPNMMPYAFNIMQLRGQTSARHCTQAQGHIGITGDIRNNQTCMFKGSIGSVHPPAQHVHEIKVSGRFKDGQSVCFVTILLKHPVGALCCGWACESRPFRQRTGRLLTMHTFSEERRVLCWDLPVACPRLPRQLFMHTKCKIEKMVLFVKSCGHPSPTLHSAA